MRQQAVASGDINNPSAAKHPSRAARHFPGFVQLFSRQTSGFAQRPADAIEEGRARKPAEVMVGQPGSGGRRETGTGHDR